MCGNLTNGNVLNQMKAHRIECKDQLTFMLTSNQSL